MIAFVGLTIPTVVKKMLKRRMIASLLLSAASLDLGWWSAMSFAQPSFAEEPHGSSKSGPIPESKPNNIFKETIPSLLRKTRVPLRLPGYVPYSDDKGLYAILEVAQPDAYSIELAWGRDCEGATACHVGYIGGTKTRPQASDKAEVPVTLTGGIRGSFVDFECGAHCDDASLYWSEGEFYYEVSLKAGNKETLIRMANTAIQAPTK
jgi:hypothetical protein